MEITNRQKLIEYVKRMLRTCQYTGVDDVRIWNDNARSSYCSLSGNTLYMSFRGDLLDSTNEKVLDALKIHAGHELAHLLVPELQIKENYRPWKNDSKENHIKSLIRCCIEVACDIWGCEMYKKTSNTDKYYATIRNLQLTLDNYKTPEKTEIFNSSKRGRLPGSTRVTLMWKAQNISNIRTIVIAYSTAMTYGGIKIDVNLYCTIINNILKQEYPVTYAILTGEYKYPRLRK